MEYDIARAKELIQKREDIDAELAEIFSATRGATPRKPQKCSICQSEGHSARTCPNKPGDSA
jgi:hypothetical protein